MAIYILFSLHGMFSSIDYDEIKLYMIIRSTIESSDMDLIIAVSKYLQGVDGLSQKRGTKS